MPYFSLFRLLFVFLGLITAADAVMVQLAHQPALSPDGRVLVFSWQGDVWTVPSAGGNATRLTWHPANDSSAVFSPDGSQIAFNSEREGSRQIYVMPSTGGEPRQLTWHTDGCELLEWLPDGRSLLVNMGRDFSWMRESRSARLALISVEERAAERLLFDDYGVDGTVSADGKRLLFMREGTESWWRQGYVGARAGQIWMQDLASGAFTKIISKNTESRWPLWRPDGRGFYFVSNRDGTYNLWEHDLNSGKDTQLTRFKDDSVLFPCLSRDGKTLVFRVRFDLYVWHPGDKEPAKITIQASGDATPKAQERRVLEKATEIAFTRDGLQMAFISGGDVWVMDTELKEPRQVTQTAEEEREVTFTPDARALVFISDAQGRTDLWKAVRADEKKAWWENQSFTLKALTADSEAESSPHFTPDGKKLAYVKNNGDLWLADADGGNAKRLIESWAEPHYEFSPDGSWVVYSMSDEWFNDDVWIMPVDGSRPPYNLSRHPNNDTSPVWSPDGQKIAWIGKREFDEVDVFYVNLRVEEDEKTRRERTLKKAREKMKPAPKAPVRAEAKPPVADAKTEEGKPAAGAPAAKAAEALKIDFEDIEERVHRLRIPNSSEAALLWSPDSKKLAFHASIDGKKGTYAVEVPDDLTPKLLAAATLTGAVWLKQDDQIVGLQEGRPATINGKTAALKTFSFKTPQTLVRADKQRAVFDQCWQVMRDRFYDERHGNKDWDAVRTKYAEAAAEAPDMKGVAEVVSLMLGELNGSHLGFMLDAATTTDGSWREETAHLGLRFDTSFSGPGWRVRDVLPKGPATRSGSRIEPGEVLLKIDGKDLLPTMDSSLVLNGHPERDISLTVKSATDAQRVVTLRPISYTSARQLLYDAWIRENRRQVEEKSKGSLGYLHISAMDDASFQKFQEELYKAGAGRDGLVIDVRENGGGSTTDHLLTSLTQPQHAITLPRGGDKTGYPQDRIVYATWQKPIIVLCNQNSYSNAEIFSHAVKVLKRGKLVGVPTAGGVISTGATNIMDVGKLRVPFRGWYGINSGIDMELNGAQPDFIIWPLPGDHAKGIDAQLNKAIEVLGREVSEWKARPKPKLIKATERK